ncbi:hypothetical protein EYF80_056048 [Liparis tanakae]|uniref:Secreted protein n=1 Tax=Liparis tanakae TaxID=230148 RepID=A0A4Z2EYE9_9TELE|nr:hypothetical protein EYF80_056048 [Liparis tanakae]
MDLLWIAGFLVSVCARFASAERHSVYWNSTNPNKRVYSSSRVGPSVSSPPPPLEWLVEVEAVEPVGELQQVHAPVCEACAYSEKKDEIGT